MALRRWPPLRRLRESWFAQSAQQFFDKLLSTDYLPVLSPRARPPGQQGEDRCVVFTCNVAFTGCCRNIQDTTAGPKERSATALPVRSRELEGASVLVLRRNRVDTIVPNYRILRGISAWWSTVCRHKSYRKDRVSSMLWETIQSGDP